MAGANAARRVSHKLARSSPTLSPCWAISAASIVAVAVAVDIWRPRSFFLCREQPLMVLLHELGDLPE
jgi:hypothetical protein